MRHTLFFEFDTTVGACRFFENHAQLWTACFTKHSLATGALPPCGFKECSYFSSALGAKTFCHFASPKYNGVLKNMKLVHLFVACFLYFSATIFNMHF